MPTLEPPREPWTATEPELSALYTRELPFVWRSVRRLGVPARDLPDVVHDVFVTVLRNLWKFDPTRELRPWLFGVLVRVVSDHQRLARHHRETFDAPAEPVDRAPRPDENAELLERWRLIDRALAAVDLPHRAVLILHDFEGHDGPEIARALGIRHKTVYSRLRKARERFVTAATAEQKVPRTRASPPRALQLLEEPLETLLNRRIHGGWLLGLAPAGADPARG